jgi:uncharacterized protein
VAEYKILITGPMGAGKTTAIAAVSEIGVVSTDVKNSDTAQSQKATTTVAMDYGQISLGDSDRLRIYGTPGQERFDFMWKILSRGALGLIILLDNGRPNPLQDLNKFLDGFAPLITETGAVVGVSNKPNIPNSPSIDAYYEVLAARNMMLPLFEVDVRKKGDVLLLLDSLLSVLEIR